MKKNKILAIVSAITMTAISSVPLFTSALATSPDTAGTFDDLENVLDPEKTFVKRSDKDNSLCVIYENNDVFAYRECENVLCVRVKDGTELKEEDVKYGKSCALSEVSDNVYLVGHSIYMDDEGRNNIIENLKAKENVVSIDYCTALAKNNGMLYSVDIESKLTDEEIQERYSIEGVESNEGKDVRYFEYANAKEKIFKDYDLLSALKADEDINLVDFSVIYNASSSTPENKGKLTENLYTAAIKGDVNADGKADIADVVAVSAYTGNSESNSFRAEQQVINGDVHNTGDGLTANDALMIQQYIAGMIDSLE